MNFLEPLFGGVLIGIAVSLMLLFNGRVTGISGIVGGILKPAKNDFSWRVSFILGLLAGGFVLKFTYPQAFVFQSANHIFALVLAGTLVGFGTLLGNGCTSGHGVCGVSRLSLRSIVATVCFILAGAMIVFLFKTMGGL